MLEALEGAAPWIPATQSAAGCPSLVEERLPLISSDGHRRGLPGLLLRSGPSSSGRAGIAAGCPRAVAKSGLSFPVERESARLARGSGQERPVLRRRITVAVCGRRTGPPGVPARHSHTGPSSRHGMPRLAGVGHEHAFRVLKLQSSPAPVGRSDRPSARTARRAMPFSLRQRRPASTTNPASAAIIGRPIDRFPARARSSTRGPHQAVDAHDT
jgi:hypothetical protein